MLFSALAIIGLLGGAMTSYIKGPMTTAVRLTRANTAQVQMAMAAQSAIMAAASLGASGDCDADGYIEPMEWRVDATKPTPAGGKLLPATIGAATIDPWGSDYGYCVWDHGAAALNAACQINAPGTNARLAGTASKLYPVVAVISAGPDKAFASTCRTFAAADVNSNGSLGDAGDFELAQKDSASNDDIIFTYTYEEATAASGGLWTLKSGDAATATIPKAIEVPQAKFTGTSLLTSVGALPPVNADCAGLGSAFYNDSASGHCYFKTAATGTWSAGKTACAASGGYLTSIGSAAEDVALVTNLALSANAYIGGSDSTDEGQWRWDGGPEAGVQFWSGASSGSGGVAVGGAYTTWNSTEPSTGSTANDFASLGTNQKWSASDGTASLYSLCEKDQTFNSVAMASGLRLADETVMPTCNATNAGVVRRLTTSGNAMQICDGTSWITQSGSSGLDDLTDAITNYARDNIFIGPATGSVNVTGYGNLIAATGSGGITTGLTTGSGNTGFGFDVLKNLNASGSYNTALGYYALRNMASANGNTCAGANVCAGTALGSYNTGAGYFAINTNPSAAATAIGHTAGRNNSGATNLTALGYQALTANTTGPDNTALGQQALTANTTGGDNTALGTSALRVNVSGGSNTAIGPSALSNSLANASTAVGYLALNTLANGDGNTALGYQSLTAANNTPSTGPNTAAGYQSLAALTTSAGNIALGYQATAAMVAGTENVAIGHLAMAARSGSANVAVGSDAMNSAFSGNDGAVAIGYQAMKLGNANGQTGIGYQALYNLNNSMGRNTAAGYQALYTVTSAPANTAAGYQALYSVNTGQQNTAAGYQAIRSTDATAGTAAGYLASLSGGGSYSTAAGFRALKSGTGAQNVAIGADAGYALTTGTDSTLAGYQSGYSLTSGQYNSAVGYQSLYSLTTGARNLAAGALAGYSGSTNNFGTYAGYRAGYAHTAQNATFIGYSAGASYTTGSNAEALGAGAAGLATGPGVMPAAGFMVVGNMTMSTAYGANAGSMASLGVTSGGNPHSFGYKAAGASTTGPICAGAFACFSASGSGIVGYGYRAAYNVTNNVSAIGSLAGATTFSNVMAVGYNAQAANINMARLGDANVTLIEGQVAFTATSDRRAKKDIAPSDLGLDFILGLKPVSYRLKQGNGRLDYGFLAQDIEKSLDGRSANMVTRLDDAVKTYQLRSADLLAPLVKAVQERQAKIEAMRREIAGLKNQPANCGGVR